MSSLVILKLLLSHKTFVTVGVWAWEWLVPGMAVHVSHQFWFVAEVTTARGVCRRIMFTAILPQASICPILTGMVVFDVIIKSLC